MDAVQNKSQKSAEDVPKDLEYEDLVTSIRCHPAQDIIATGLMSGNIILNSFSADDGNKELLKFTNHKKACRSLKFSQDGKRLYSVSKDKSLYCFDVESGKLKKKIRKAHNSPIYSVELTGDTFVATGDDDGVLKLWDMRTKECTMELKECDEFISDMLVDDGKKILLATSGEGTLTAFNIRRKRMEMQSELFDSELLCLAKMKSGQKLVCGTGEGVLNMFNWGQWGNISDRYPCGDSQINCLAPITDFIVCTGSDDGYIKAVHVYPNRTLGLVGQHMEDFPVEGLGLTADRTCLASCSHDQKVKFWNIEELKKEKVDTTRKAGKKGKKLKKFSKAKQADFFADLVDTETQKEAGSGGEDEEEDSDDDSD